MPDDCNSVKLEVVYQNIFSTPNINALNIEHSAEAINNYLYIYDMRYIYIYMYVYVYVYI